MKSIQETRRIRLKQIIDEDFEGSQTKFASAMGWATPNYASRLLSQSPDNLKAIGNRLARAIEGVARRPANFLDTPPESAQSIRIGGIEIALEPLESQLILLFRRLSRDAQESLFGRAQTLYFAEYREGPVDIPPAPSSALPRPMKAAAARRRKR